jgi:Asp-tRNA(Asn)/Glu-tRNA(Gln) amidotransferase A subunit family amidase
VVNAICLEQLLNAGGKCQEKTKSDELAFSLIGANPFYGTPQITIPVAEANGVPIGLSFIAGYGQDMKLINICNQLFTGYR